MKTKTKQNIEGIIKEVKAIQAKHVSSLTENALLKDFLKLLKKEIVEVSDTYTNNLIDNAKNASEYVEFTNHLQEKYHIKLYLAINESTINLLDKEFKKIDSNSKNIITNIYNLIKHYTLNDVNNKQLLDNDILVRIDDVAIDCNVDDVYSSKLGWLDRYEIDFNIIYIY